MTDGIPVLTPLADQLEELVAGRFRSQYAWVVRGLTALSALLVVVSGVLFLVDRAGLDAGTYGPVLEVTGVVVALFVLLGVAQFLLLARAVDRTAEEVTAVADEVETGAEEVLDAADEVAAGAEEVETAASEVEAVTEDVEAVAEDVEPVADEAQERGETAKESAEEAKEAGETAKDVASEAKERLGEQERDGDDE